LLEAPTAARLHGLAARALYALGRFGSAAEHAGSAVRAWQRSGEEPLELGPVLLVSARMAMLNARPDEAGAAVAQALDALRPLGSSRPLGQAYAAMADLETLEGNGA